MSERLTGHETHESLRAGNHESLKHRKSPEHHVKNNSAERAHQAREAIRHETKTQANPLEDLKAVENASKPYVDPHVDRELRQITLRRELKNIRRKLPAPQRAFSRVIHQPVVRITSEAAGKTISRPSGLLGGGFVALLGTSTYLYLAKHIGFSYNYGVFLILFAGGFALGLAIELVVNLIFRANQKARR